jgi:hypothetical protein
MCQQKNRFFGMIDDPVRQTWLIVGDQRDDILPRDILRGDQNEFVPRYSRPKCNVLDSAPRNLAANRRTVKYCACPVTLSRPSLRGTDTPTMRSAVMEFDYRISARGLPPPFPPRRLSGKTTVRKHRLAPEIRRLHHPAKGFSEIGRDRMPVVQSLGRHMKS